jgi:hypothetical protein
VEWLRDAKRAASSANSGTLELKGRKTMNSRSQRSVINDLAEAELVAPLSGPGYGPFNIARRRWHKPLPAIIADALANCRAVSARLQRGMYIPDLENKPQYQAVYNQLCECTRQQLKALEAFSAIEWRE